MTSVVACRFQDNYPAPVASRSLRRFRLTPTSGYTGRFIDMTEMNAPQESRLIDIRAG